MSVLVKEWSIPTNGCCGCHFRTGKYCGILHKNERVLEYAERYTRPDNCPLVEVPTPHGRMIDADAIEDFIENRYTITWEADTYEGGIKDACTDILEFMNAQPTVDAVQVKHGKWIPDKTGNSYWICTSGSKLEKENASDI